MFVAQLKSAILITIVFTVLTGLIYPMAITGVSQLLFPHQANGSLLANGSELIGQNFTKPEYFHGRPSAAGNGYDATSSGGSNLGPSNPALADRLKKDIAAFRKENPSFTGPLPADLVTTSASGLDPDVSPASALAQVDRVAAARHVSPAVLKDLIATNTAGRQLGFLGEPRVNILKLNLAVDSAFPMRK
jgi:K+-transporting ATPase ATPase C chain